MRFLRVRSLETLAVVAAFLVGLATFFSLLRLLPWLVHPTVTLASLSPIAQAILSSVLEVLAVALPPLALGITAASANARREIMTLASLGVSPARVALALAPVSLVVALLLGGALTLAPPSSRSVGRFVERLVLLGRAACEGPGPRVSTVPLLGYDWLCPEAGSPVLVGRLPRGQWFAAQGLASSASRSDESDPGELGATTPREFIELQAAQIVARGSNHESVHMALGSARVDLGSDWFGTRREAALGGIAAPVLSGLLTGPWVVLLIVVARVESLLGALAILVPGPVALLMVMEVGWPGVRDPSWLALSISTLVPLLGVTIHRAIFADKTARERRSA